MSMQTWRSCLWEILFPMLDRVRRLASEASAEVNAGQELGKERGKSVMLMVHHSRNSAQKQWDETLVLCLNGMGRLLRSHLGVLSGLEGFEQRWDALMGFVEHSVLAGSREVGCAAVTSFVAVLSAHAGATSLPGALWERALGGFSATASRACEPESAVPGKARALPCAGPRAPSTQLSLLPTFVLLRPKTLSQQEHLFTHCSADAAGCAGVSPAGSRGDGCGDVQTVCHAPSCFPPSGRGHSL